MTDRELMQQALDALQEYVGVVVSVNDPNDWTPKVADAGEPARKAIEALRARLAQPEPEPVAWVLEAQMVWWNDKFTHISQAPPRNTPLYTAPPQREWQGLTTAERKALWNVTKKPSEFAEMVEAKLKEKNEWTCKN